MNYTEAIEYLEKQKAIFSRTMSPEMTDAILKSLEAMHIAEGSKSTPLTRYDFIKRLSIEEIANYIIDYAIPLKFCKYTDTCGTNDKNLCPHDLECCVRWLSEPFSAEPT